MIGDSWIIFIKIEIQIMNIIWYFDITKVKIDNFSIKSFSKEDEILLVEAGLSSILDYFNQNDYDKITIFDFCEELVKKY